MKRLFLFGLSGAWVSVALLGYGCGSDEFTGSDDNGCPAGDCGSEAGAAGDGAGGSTSGSGGEGSGQGGSSSGGSGNVSGEAGAPTEGGTGGAGANGGSSGNGGSSTGGGSGTGGDTMTPSYLFLADNNRNGAIMELDPQTGDVTNTKVIASARGFPADLAVAPDGTLRLLQALGSEAWIVILDTEIELVDTRSYVFPSAETVLFTKGPNGRGELFTNSTNGGMVLNELDANDELTGATSPYHAGPRPVSYWILPNGDARVLATPEQGRTSIISVDQYGDPVGDTVDCENPGWRAMSYSLARDGTVWVGYNNATSLEARVCAYADEASFDCGTANEGWGVGGCRTYTYTSTMFLFDDFAIAP